MRMYIPRNEHHLEHSITQNVMVITFSMCNRENDPKYVLLNL